MSKKICIVTCNDKLILCADNFDTALDAALLVVRPEISEEDIRNEFNVKREVTIKSFYTIYAEYQNHVYEPLVYPSVTIKEYELRSADNEQKQ